MTVKKSKKMSKSKPTTKLKAAPADAVTSLPGLGKVDGVQFAGYASVHGGTGSNGAEAADESLFYWFVGSDDYRTRPTILWTNGGPGSSSFWGFFLENGPYEIDPTGTKLTKRPTAWNNYANYMIFEHPLSVTLSFAKDDNDVPKTVEMGIAQLYQALLNFIDLHPELAYNPIILAGESYAGTYLPLLAKAILEGNKKSGPTKIDLRAMVLLDAWVNPMVQMASDTTYAFAHGLISASQKNVLDETYTGPVYLSQINTAIQNLCGCYMANIAQVKDPSFDPIYAYLNLTDTTGQFVVRQALHVDNQTKLTENWSKQVGKNYAHQVNDSYAGVVQELLDGGPNGGQDEDNKLLLLDGVSKLKVQVVSGLNDAKDCNFIGTGAWLDLLQGDAALAFKAATPAQWKVNQTVLGFVQDGGLLSWLKVLNAGHMAVMDQPELIHYILNVLPKPDGRKPKS
jgi:vitellogenic carboxypeptidase-like protein